MAKKGTVSRFLLIELLCRNRSKFLTYPPREATVINQTKREQYCLFIFSLSALLLPTTMYKIFFSSSSDLHLVSEAAELSLELLSRPLGIEASLVRNSPPHQHPEK